MHQRRGYRGPFARNLQEGNDRRTYLTLHDASSGSVVACFDTAGLCGEAGVQAIGQLLTDTDVDMFDGLLKHDSFHTGAELKDTRSSCRFP